MGTARNDSESRRKKTSNIRPLEMFLLGLVSGGLITPYDWQTKASVSLGASLPAVRRLLDAGLLKRLANGQRGRHEFGLTAKGRLELDNLDSYLEGVLDQPLGDLESVLRLASLATCIDHVDIAKTLLQRAAILHRQKEQTARKRTTMSPFKSRLGGLYFMLSNRCEKEQHTAIADQLERLRRNWDTLTEQILKAGQRSPTSRR